MPLSSRLYGEQRAILLEYLDGEMLLPDNATDESMAKAIQYLERIHELSLLHGDVHQFMVGTPRNVMLLKNGDVKWIDFERSQIGAQEEELEFELGVVKAVIGPKGLLWRRRYTILVFDASKLLLSIVHADRVCPTMENELSAPTVIKVMSGNRFGRFHNVLLEPKLYGVRLTKQRLIFYLIFPGCSSAHPPSSNSTAPTARPPTIHLRFLRFVRV